jgi:hypothetical protein
VVKCPLYNPIRDKFPSLFENIVPRNFFQLDQHVNISLALTDASTLHHSREFIGLKPSWCTFNASSLFSFLDFQINFTLLHVNPKVCIVKIESHIFLNAIIYKVGLQENVSFP